LRKQLAHCNVFALHSPKVFHLLPGNMEKLGGDYEVGWFKVACWSTKAAISLKRVKIEDKKAVLSQT